MKNIILSLAVLLNVGCSTTYWTEMPDRFAYGYKASMHDSFAEGCGGHGNIYISNHRTQEEVVQRYETWKETGDLGDCDNVVGYKKLAAEIDQIWNDAYQSQDTCGKVGMVASKVMIARQSGKPMSVLYSAADNKFAKAMIIDAWESPHYITDKVKREEIGDFRDKYYLACVKAGL